MAMGLRSCCVVLRPVLESPTFITSFDDIAVLGVTVEQRGGYLGVTENCRLFANGQVGGDDGQYSFEELADEMEQKLAAGLREGQIAMLVQDQEVEERGQVGGLPVPFGAGFSVQFVHQVDDIEEPTSSSDPAAGVYDVDGEMRLAVSGVPIGIRLRW